MTSGPRHRLTGTLSSRRRGYLLTCDDEAVWTVEFVEGVTIPMDERVVVEGQETGPAQLLGDWVAPAP